MYSGHSRSVYRRGDESYKCTLCTSDTRWAHRTWRNQSERCSTLWDRSTRGESAVVNYITQADSDILLLQWLGYFYHMIWTTRWWPPRCRHSGHHLSTSDKLLFKHIIGWLSLAVLILSRSLIWSNACCFFPITFVQKRELYSKSVRNLTTFSSQPLTGWIDLLLRIYLDQIYVPKPLS